MLKYLREREIDREKERENERERGRQNRQRRHIYFQTKYLWNQSYNKRQDFSFNWTFHTRGQTDKNRINILNNQNAEQSIALIKNTDRQKSGKSIRPHQQNTFLLD